MKHTMHSHLFSGLQQMVSSGQIQHFMDRYLGRDLPWASEEASAGDDLDGGSQQQQLNFLQTGMAFCVLIMGASVALLALAVEAVSFRLGWERQLLGLVREERGGGFHMYRGRK